MGIEFKILHPKDGRHFKHGKLVLFGRSPLKQSEMAATLWNGQGQKVADGKVPRKPCKSLWAFYFKPVPKGKGYRVQVIETRTGKVLGVVEGLTVTDSFGIEIEYPITGDFPVNGSFISYGGSNEVVSLVGSVNPGSYAGTCLDGPPDDSDWYFEFDNIPNGSYTMTIQTSTGSSVATQAITVVNV